MVETLDLGWVFCVDVKVFVVLNPVDGDGYESVVLEKVDPLAPIFLSVVSTVRFIFETETLHLVSLDQSFLSIQAQHWL